jgi:hypothetical protein
MSKPNSWEARVVLGAFAVVCSAPACAGNSSEPAAGGAAGIAGTASGGGGATSAHGGSDSGSGGTAQQLPAQAGLTATVGLTAVRVDGTACPAVRTYQVGAPQAPTMNDPGASVVSGDAGSTIACSVTSSAGGGFEFSGTLHAATNEGDLISISFANGSVSGDSGTADVSIYTPHLSANFASQKPCTIQVLNQQVKAGSMWAAFDCAEISSAPSGLCGLQGVVVLENCDGT